MKRIPKYFTRRKNQINRFYVPDRKTPKVWGFMQLLFAPLLASLITGAILFYLQYNFGPRLERKKVAEITIWQEKKDALIKAASLVDDLYKTLHFGKKDTSRLRFDKYDEVNNVYFKILLLCDDPDISKTFWKFFDASNASFTPVQRAAFIGLLRKELTGKELNIRQDSIPIIKDTKYFRK
jgi:hypothetical protein